MADVVIFGTGDIARLAHAYFTRDSDHRVVGFTVDAAFRTGSEFAGLPVVDFETVEQRFPPAHCAMFVALSYARMNRLRAEKFQAAKERGYTLVSYVSSRCTWLTDQAMGENCFILEDNTVQPFVRVGDNVTLWSGSHVGHDSVIGDHVFVGPHAAISGNVTVGAHSFIGINATLRNGITLAPRTLVGAGAVVMSDTAEGSVHVSRPAQQLDKTSDDVNL